MELMKRIGAHIIKLIKCDWAIFLANLIKLVKQDWPIFLANIIKLVKRDWPVFVIMALLFGSGIWMGERLNQVNPSMAKLIEQVVLKKFSIMAQRLKHLPFFVWILAIWGNNLLVALVAFLLGIIVIFPALIVLEQGVIVGLVQKLTEIHGTSSVSFYLGLTPHGIFELPAIFIAAGLGIRFGLTIYRSLWYSLTNRESKKMLLDFIIELKYYAILVIALLTLAAVIEVTVSPLLIH